MSPQQNDFFQHSPMFAFSILFHLLLVLLLLQVHFGVVVETSPAKTTAISVFFGESENTGEEAALGEPEAEEKPSESEAEKAEEPLPAETSETSTSAEQTQLTAETLFSSETNHSENFGVGASPQTAQNFQALLKNNAPVKPLHPPSSSSSKLLSAKEVFSSRSSKGRKDGTAQNGGSSATESAVESALEWLAKHQSTNGSFDPVAFNERCPCSGKGYATYHQGLTGLVLLCFSGAGYTHQSGPYQREVKTALEFLKIQQDPSGRFAPTNMYNHAIVLLALAEIYALTKDASLLGYLRKGIAFSQNSQQPGGGWSYAANPQPSRNDTSITGFMLMALITCHIAGVEVDTVVFRGVARHFSEMTDPDGTVIYADNGDNASRGGLGMIAVGLYARLALGLSPRHSLSRKQTELLLGNLPQWNKASELNNSMYYWYYGTLATFFMEPNDFNRWNQALQQTLLPQQQRQGHLKGSFDPDCKWGKHGGRIYATAMNTLCLEIYYKYSPQYLQSLPEFKKFWDDEKKWKPWEKKIVGKRE